MKRKVISFIILVCSDIAVVLFCFWFAFLVRDNILPRLFFNFFKIPQQPLSVYVEHFYMGFVWLAVFAYEKLYTKRYLFWEEVKILLKSTTISSSIVMIMIFISKKQLLFSRTIVVLVWLLSLVLFPFSRQLTKNLLIKFNLWKKKLIILGVMETSLLALESIKKNKTMGYEIIGFLDDDPKKIGMKFLGTKVLGPIADLPNITQAFGSNDIMLATPHLPREELKKLLLKCENYSESLWLIPRTGDFITEGVEINVFGDVFAFKIKKNLMKPWNILLKYLFDECFALVFIILFLPLFFIIALAIRLDSKGPIIFIQERLGYKKKSFIVFKFRSMYVDSDKYLTKYLEINPEAKDEWEKYKKIKGYDPRVTKVGRLIRKYSLDELPQLFNIMQGKMSLVGPRPYLHDELKDKDSFKNVIAKVKPGITGIWQISGRSDLPFTKRISLDEFYIRNWSLWLDITILLRSLKVWLSRKGAF